MPKIKLGQKIIDASHEPYVIAEIGVNHEGSLELAKKLIELAHEGGADAAKFQTYKAGSLASKNSPSYWDLKKEPTTSQYQLFQKYDAFGEEEYKILAEHCRKVGIEFVSTPFDEKSVDFLDPLMSYYKIASADLTNIPLLKKIAGKKKPVVLSTGASTLSEIDLAVMTLREAGCEDVALLHCVLNYPTAPENAHLAMIDSLKHSYPELVIGYSDHVPPDQNMVTLTTAYLKGAWIIEKHFTHDKTLPGNDHYHAMDCHDLRNFRKQASHIRKLLGNVTLKQPLESEKISRLNARRSLVLTRSLVEGTVIKESDLTCKRPGTGISPINYNDVIGRKVVRSLEEDHILKWNDLKEEA